MFLLWTLVGLMFVAPTYLQYAADDLAVPWSRLSSDLAGWYLWALLFPIIFWAARRFPFERRVWRSRVLIHAIIGSAVSTVYAFLVVLKSYFIIAIATMDFRPHLLKMGPDYLFGGFEFYFLIYGAVVAAVHAFDYYRKYQERELKTTRLEAQLAQAQLQVLRMQLHPHFLFNTLHAISALMHRNVEAADRMIALLSDFLRLSLENAGRQEVPLKNELDFLERYMEIEKTRFGERLTVKVDVEPEALDAAVPNFILQPLVENAVGHGISRRSSPGRIEVRARLEAPGRFDVRARRPHRRLELQVVDNGPGTPGGAAPMPGVGMTNTRARLEQLYGSDQLFEAGNGEGGGFRVKVTLPYRPYEEEDWVADGIDEEAEEVPFAADVRSAES
jgi:sensor histidine kinase YesM